MFSNRVEITLESVLGTITLTEDPINHDQSEFNIARSEKTYGILLTVINNLEFVGEAKNYLDALYALHGVHAKCRQSRKEKHPTTDKWQDPVIGYLDFSTRKIKDGKFQIDFIEGGLRELLASQIKEKFELNRKTDIEGNDIPELKRDILGLLGKDVFLSSRFENDVDEFTTQSGRWSSGNEDREAFHPLPLTVKTNSDNLNIQAPLASYAIEERYQQSLGNMFFAVADRDRGKVSFSGNASFFVESIDGNRVNEFNMKLVLRRYTSDADGGNLVLEETTVLEDLGDPRVNDAFTLSWNFELEPKENESYAIGLLSVGQYGGGFPVRYDGKNNVTFAKYKANAIWAEDSFYKATSNPCITAHDMFSRLSEIYAGTPCFESYLLDGRDITLLTDANHNIVFAPGGWIRNLKKKTENEELSEWPMTMSFEDAYASIHAFMPVGYGISTVGNTQKIVLEDLRFFFQRTVMGSLGKIDIKERSTAVEFCYQSMQFGYEKGGDDEIVLGLDEYNTRATSRTPLTVTDNEYNALSPSRADVYKPEIERRKQFSDFPDLSSETDNDNWMFDVKKTAEYVEQNAYEVRTWQDDFEQAPKAVYSPETAYNLNFTPARNRERHSWWWDNSVYMLKDKDIQFVSGKGNSELITKKPGEPELKENQLKTPIPEFDRPLFEPEWIDAEKEFEQELYEKILGSTVIDGRKINNYYGLWEFLNEQNQPEYAYIFRVRSKDKFTFQLLKANY
ncbi:hypothetical protein [uncultured Christiangramia sp.]|uniref:hypothetical protein n=1 Tax=uncultured Christiangramia sp. TaxID=503836 RepID=UPI002621F4FE|nr:hypothetical protein [uncultured Christiangramia sp.]